MDLADGLEQLFAGRTLEQVSVRARLHRALDFDIAVERSEHDDAGFWKFRADGDQRLDSAHVRETEVHQGDVGLVLAKSLDGLFAGGGDGREGHVRLAVYDGGDSLAQKRVVVDAQDSDPR